MPTVPANDRDLPRDRMDSSAAKPLASERSSDAVTNSAIDATFRIGVGAGCHLITHKAADLRKSGQPWRMHPTHRRTIYLGAWTKPCPIHPQQPRNIHDSRWNHNRRTPRFLSMVVSVFIFMGTSAMPA